MNKCKTLGTLYIVAAPSGGGKSSLVASLLEAMDNLELSISHTTRDKRAGEIQGQHYHFIDELAFEAMVKAGEFIEYAKVFDRYYGTSIVQIESRLKKGIDVILDIDWQGAKQLRQQFEQVVSIFIIPPSLEELMQRLQSRGRDDLDVIKARMQQAQAEISHFEEFDYLIINDDFQQALGELKSIVQANRLKLSIQREKCAKLLSLLLQKQ